MERPPISELDTEGLEIAMALRGAGSENPEVRERLIRWTKAQEAWAGEQNTSRANIEVNLRRARLYRAAGFHREAWDTLNEVREQAHNEGEGDLFQAAEELMSEIEYEGAD